MPGADILVQVEHGDEWLLDLSVRLVGPIFRGPVRVDGLSLQGDEREAGVVHYDHESGVREGADPLRIELPDGHGAAFEFGVPLLDRAGDGSVRLEGAAGALEFAFSWSEPGPPEGDVGVWRLQLFDAGGHTLLTLQGDRIPFSPLTVPASLFAGSASVPASATLSVTRRVPVDPAPYPVFVSTSHALSWTVVAGLSAETIGRPR